MYYKLDGKNPVEVQDLLEMAYLFGKNNDDRIVRYTELKKGTETIGVSTVFLCIDHAFGGGEPVLFETMVFDNKEPEKYERYTTWDLAEAGHRKIVWKLISEGCVFVKDKKKPNSLEDEFEEITRFELMDI